MSYNRSDVDHPKNVKKAEKKLKRQQRKLSRKIRTEDYQKLSLMLFANNILYKAGNAGKYSVQVIAKGTTQVCVAKQLL